MRVDNISIERSPISSERIQLRAEVTYATLPQTEIYWYDVPEQFGSDLSHSGDSWLALFLPLAVNLGESLRISRPVDPLLAEQAVELMRIWRCWYPRLHIIPLEVEVAKVEPRATARRTAAFFSSGVDAWFTLLSHQNELHTTQIDDLLTVWGLDIPLDRPREFDKLREVLGRVTSKYQLAGVEVATNFREGTNVWRARADWGQVAHGCALASIGLLFQNRYCRVLIPSTHRYDDLIPWGSHPLTDPLLSTSATQFVHDGAGFSRTEKTAFVINSQLALDNLQVCWETGELPQLRHLRQVLPYDDDSAVAWCARSLRHVCG